MLNSFITALFFTIIFASILFGLINLFRANLYDWRQTRLRNDQIKHPHVKHRRKRPLVSAVVFADNNSESMTECLIALAASYRKLEIIVIDNASKDTTAQLVRQFIKDHPKLTCRLIAKRRPTSRSQAIATAARGLKGDLVFTLDASCLIDKRALLHSVLQSNEPDTDVVLPNVRVSHNYQIMGLSSKFRAIATIWAKKSGAYIIPGLDAFNYVALYRSEVFKIIAKPANRQAFSDLNSLRRFSQKVVYDGQGLVNVMQPSSSLAHLPDWRGKQAINLVRSVLSIAEPLVICFMIYVAWRFDNASYLLLGWLSFTSLLWLAIWSDESRGFRAKVGISLLAVVSYSLYLVQALVGILKRLARLPYRGLGFSS